MGNWLASFINTIISMERSTFIKDLQILDNPLMLNEIVEHCKVLKKKLMAFKLDFEKAYDSLAWEYLLKGMRKIGLYNKWCSQIKCLFLLLTLWLLLLLDPILLSLLWNTTYEKVILFHHSYFFQQWKAFIWVFSQLEELEPFVGLLQKRQVWRFFSFCMLMMLSYYVIGIWTMLAIQFISLGFSVGFGSEN